MSDWSLCGGRPMTKRLWGFARQKRSGNTEQGEQSPRQEDVKKESEPRTEGAFVKIAEANVWSQDHFSCAICLDPLKDPVTTNCGHRTFSPRPVLSRNTMLAEVMEKLKLQGVHSASGQHAGPGDVECDVCTGDKMKAMKSCLVCLSSYCETHFRLHNDLNPGKTHKVIDATVKLEDLICSRHDKLLEVFCRTDQSCICMLCAMDEHRGHDTVSAAAGRKDKQEREFPAAQMRCKQNIQAKVAEVRKLKSALNSFKCESGKAVVDCERTCKETISFIERRFSKVIKLIKDQESMKTDQVEKFILQRGQEVAELKKKDAQLRQLSQAENHIHFLQIMTSICSSSETELPTTEVFDASSVEAEKTLSETKEAFKYVMNTKMSKLVKHVTDMKIFQPNEPRTREEFLKYCKQLTLNSDTLHPWLCLTNGNRQVSWAKAPQPYPDHPERFDSWPQVLCTEAVHGRSYWEVEWDGQGVKMAVAYKDIERKGFGTETLFGCNMQSWCLTLSKSRFYFQHNSTEMVWSPLPYVCRIGVFVDTNAGLLSFYCVTDTMQHLHTELASFSKPIYPGLEVNNGSKVAFCL